MLLASVEFTIAATGDKEDLVYSVHCNSRLCRNSCKRIYKWKRIYEGSSLQWTGWQKM